MAFSTQIESKSRVLGVSNAISGHKNCMRENHGRKVGLSSLEPDIAKNGPYIGDAYIGDECVGEPEWTFRGGRKFPEHFFRNVFVETFFDLFFKKHLR